MGNAGVRAESARPHLEYETRLLLTGAAKVVAGIDEAGRGPLAGPVVAAAVILPPGFSHAYLDDSKKLSAVQRAAVYDDLMACPEIIHAAAVVDAAEIDRLNILRATHEAMRRAFLALARQADHALIDGLPVRPFPAPHTAIVAGDGISLSIAAASIIAKVTRDRLMDEFDGMYPDYGFSRHKGYPTAHHLATLTRHGPCPIHRLTFRPVAQRCLPFAAAQPAA